MKFAAKATLLSALLGSSAHAATITVTPTTTGGIQAAGAAAKPGDTVNVTAGNYKGFTFGWDAGGKYGPIAGTATARITIQADPSAAPGSVVINAVGLLADNGQLGDCGVYLGEGGGGCKYVTIRGFTIKGNIPRTGIFAAKSTGVEILSCVVEGAGVFGINTSHTTDCLIEGNTVSKTKGSGTSGHGIYVANDALRPIVRRNTIFSNGSEGLHMNGDRTQGGTGMVDAAFVENNVIYSNVANAINCDGIKNSTFQNNLAYKNGNHGITLYKIDGSAGSTGNKIVYNTIYQTASSGAAIKLMDASTGTAVDHNILLGGNYGTFNYSTDSKVGLVSNDNIVVDKFVNETTGAITNLSQWKMAGQDSRSTLQRAADIFVDVANDNYRAKGAGIGFGYTYGTPTTQPEPPATQPAPLTDATKAYYAAFGDTTGPNGVPDGKVDAFDLNNVASHWQMTIPPKP